MTIMPYLYSVNCIIQYTVVHRDNNLQIITNISHNIFFEHFYFRLFLLNSLLENVGITSLIIKL